MSPMTPTPTAGQAALSSARAALAADRPAAHPDGPAGPRPAPGDRLSRVVSLLDASDERVSHELGELAQRPLEERADRLANLHRELTALLDEARA